MSSWNDTITLDLLSNNEPIRHNSTIYLTDGSHKLYVKYTFIAYAVMLTFGLPGNILSILTILQTSLSKAARSSLCVVLSVADICFLITQIVQMGFFHIAQINPVNFSPISCKLGDFCYCFFTHIDAFMIVLMSLERLVAVYKPHTVKTLVTPGRIKWTIFGLIVFFLIMDGELIVR